MSEKEETVEPKRAAAMPAKKVLVAKPMQRAAMPAKEVPRRVSPRTVKGKIAAIQKATAEIYSGARSIQSDAAKQMKENQEAVVAIFAGVRAIQSGINEQMKENQAYIRDFYG